MITKERFFYSNSIENFISESASSLLGELAAANGFDLTLAQRGAWQTEISILKLALKGVTSGHILFEYTIPRMGKRVDVVIIIGGVIAILEFKVGSSTFDRHAIDQTVDYALDLKYFHAASQEPVIVPVLIATDAPQSSQALVRLGEDRVAEPLCLVPSDLSVFIEACVSQVQFPPIDPQSWIRAPYRPTPTIIEAAQVLFRDHTVEDISRNDASAINLERTSAKIGAIIDDAKRTGTKRICLVTGVPGAGKTLAGLAIANSRQRFEEVEHAVFLSGNGPLVLVLQEALARDQYERGLSNTKSESLRSAKSFIQGIHHFRDDAISHTDPPHEKVAIFDEAQRAWNSDQLSKFMKMKRGQAEFHQSEPEFLIGVMDRHLGWAVIVCLVGEGQEINTGEAGISEWLNALEHRFPTWQVHTSPRIYADSYARGANVAGLFHQLGQSRVHLEESLHLSVSVRSFRSERLSAFVEALLNNQTQIARTELQAIQGVYPIVITRELERARAWVRQQARGTERYGLTASSGAKRLRPHGIWVDYRNDPREWFLNDKSDIRSSFGLEITATEFDVQGLEIDWSIVAWDGDLRHNGQRFTHWNFRGKSWERVASPERQQYLTNAYRVLLTRARQGMVVFLPKGDPNDPTRPHEYFDGTFDYLKGIGIPEI